MTFGISTTGSSVRGGINQDAACGAIIDTERGRRFVGCLADGMGALEAPSEASSIAVESALLNFLSHTDHISERCARMVIAANDAVLSIAQGRNLGTTLTCLIVNEDGYHFGHVGDNRLYRIGRDVKCLTTDHSRLAVKLGLRNPDRELVKTKKSAKNLSKSLGETSFSLEYVDCGSSCDFDDLELGDCLVLCSDGVWTELEESEILQLTITDAPAQSVAESLTKLAMMRDPSDDCSAIVVRP